MRFAVQSLIAFLLLFILPSCKYFNKKSLNRDSKLIATAGDANLFYSDIEPIIIGAVGTSDSASIVKSYAEEWVKRKLMMEKALLYLPEDKLNIDRQVADYKESLILYNYEKELILQKLDTVVDESILLNYYDEYKTNFELKDDVVQMLYVKVPIDVSSIDSVKSWIASKEEADKIKLEDYCHQYATDYSLSDSMWYEIPSVYSNVPVSPYQLEVARLYRNTLTVSDSLFNYVMKINGSSSKGEIAPYHYVKNDIARIILNKRKRDLVRSTLENVYLEGKRNNKFKIYE